MYPTNIKVLFFSPSQIGRSNFKEVLRKLKFFDIVEARSINEARNFIRTSHYKLIFIDIYMEQESALNFLEMVKSDELHRSSHVVMMTTIDQRELLGKALIHGLRNYILKPYSIQDLDEKLVETFDPSIKKIAPPPEPLFGADNQGRDQSPKTFPPQSKILIADDMMTIRRLLEKSCVQLGYQHITTVKDGVEAWEALQNSGLTFDLIISDWNMPNCTGIDLLHRIRKDLRLCSLPFVFVTAETDDDQVEAAYSTGAHAILPKPFTREQLKETLQLAYEKRFG